MTHPFFSLQETLPSTVTLVAVSKQHSCQAIEELYQLGQRIFGENRVQELCEKYEQLPKDIEWHFIGSLQKNKVKYLVNKVRLIHSLDSLSLALEIEKQYQKQGKIAHCLLQINIGDDPNKSGLNIHEIYPFLQKMSSFNHLKLTGCMTILPQVPLEETKRFFQQMNQLFKKLQLDFPNLPLTILSMGMSQDYLEAIESGASMVRIGSKLFGSRNMM